MREVYQDRKGWKKQMMAKHIELEELRHELKKLEDELL